MNNNAKCGMPLFKLLNDVQTFRRTVVRLLWVMCVCLESSKLESEICMYCGYCQSQIDSVIVTGVPATDRGNTVRFATFFVCCCSKFEQQQLFKKI